MNIAASNTLTPRASQIYLRHFFISPSHIYAGHHGRSAGREPMLEVRTLVCAAGRGVRGDRYFDREENYKGQITFFASAAYERICAALQIWDRPPSVFRRNVITDGIDLNDWIGREFSIQGVGFRGTEECRPCYWMDQAFGPGACDLLRGSGGLRAVVLTDGVLRVDEKDALSFE